MVPFARLPHPVADESWLRKIVAAAFAQRRKTLRNALKAHFSANDLERLGVSPGARAQELSVADFALLADEAARAATAA
jgi:16S rRNA (adenine1518-N6/adenine1519-N6)-dimethyltransferase